MYIRSLPADCPYPSLIQLLEFEGFDKDKFLKDRDPQGSSSLLKNHLNSAL
jgi:hypothetical protein